MRFLRNLTEMEGSTEESAVAKAHAKFSKLETAEDVLAELGHLTKEELVSEEEEEKEKKGEKPKKPENSCGARTRWKGTRRCSLWR